jgi:hypothetical protein
MILAILSDYSILRNRFCNGIPPLLYQTEGLADAKQRCNPMSEINGSSEKSFKASS